MKRQPRNKQPLASLIRQMIDHLDQAELFEIVGELYRAQWERAMAEEYRDMCRYRRESEGSSRA